MKLPKVIATLIACHVASVSYAQNDCRSTPEGILCTGVSRIIAGDLVDVSLQRELGLITVGGVCSGTLVNRYWVLTADHCVTTNGVMGGPDRLFENTLITAAWSPRTVQPTRFVRNWHPSGRDIALIYLGAGDFGLDYIQLFYVNPLEENQPVVKFGRGMATYAIPAGSFTPPQPGLFDGLYGTANFTSHSAANAAGYDLPVNDHTPPQVGAGGDSGGGDRVTSNGTIMGIVGVQSKCSLNVTTDVLPGMPTPLSTPPDWQWVTRIRSCFSASIDPVRADIVAIIQEGRRPCEETSAACFASESTNLMLHP